MFKQENKPYIVSAVGRKSHDMTSSKQMTEVLHFTSGETADKLCL